MGAELQGNWFNNKSTSGRPGTSRDPENVERVRASFRAQPAFSARKQSCILKVLRASLNRILHKDLNLQPYKTNMGQHVTPPTTHCVQYAKFLDIQKR